MAASAGAHFASDAKPMFTKGGTRACAFCRLGAGYWSELEDIRHSTELGKRTGFHLSHQVGAMHLHGGFGDADIVSNLLVKKTSRDPNYDLTLARAKGFETLLERTQ